MKRNGWRTKLVTKRNSILKLLFLFCTIIPLIWTANGNGPVLSREQYLALEAAVNDAEQAAVEGTGGKHAYIVMLLERWGIPVASTTSWQIVRFAQHLLEKVGKSNQRIREGIMAEKGIRIGDIIKTAGSFGVVLDIFENASGKRVYQIFFPKNAARLQPPEMHPEDMLPKITPATVAEIEEEIELYKKRIDEQIQSLRAHLPAPSDTD